MERINEWHTYSINGTYRESSRFFKRTLMYLLVLVARPCLRFGMCRGLIITLAVVDCIAITLKYISNLGSFNM